MRFKELDTVKLIGKFKADGRPYCIQDIELDMVKIRGKSLRSCRGLITKCNLSDFGETYEIVWDDGSETVMHGSNLAKARFDIV